MCFRKVGCHPFIDGKLIAGQFDPGRSEVVGLAGNPDQAYGAELAERGYPAPRAFDSLEPRDFAIHGRRLRRCWNVAIDPASTSAFHRW